MAEKQTPLVNPENESITRKVLSWSIILFSFIVIIYLVNAAMSISFQNDKAKDQFEVAKYVFGIILPLLGTWIGTVIAFYYSKDNFQVASNSMQYMFKNFTSSNEKLNSIKVTDPNVMRLLQDISYNKNIASKKDEEIFIKADMIDFINSNNKGDRLPIFDDKNVLRYIVHLSTLNDFAIKCNDKKFDKLKDKELPKITMKDVLENSDAETAKRFLSGAGFVSKNANLLDAQAIIVNNPYCQDVLVTETGSKSEPVMGWITNNKITELARL